LLNDIELKKAEINSLNDQLQRMKQELNAEKESIETDRRYTYDNPQKIHSLNVKISAYNEKSRWYNRLVADTQGKAAVLESMVNTYNRMLQTYNDCSASN
jgi:chromosome segregation ATPase